MLFRLRSNGVLDQSGLVPDYTTPHVVKCTHLLSRLSRPTSQSREVWKARFRTEMIHSPCSATQASSACSYKGGSSGTDGKGHEIGHGKGSAGLAICSGGLPLRRAFELQDLITKPVFPERACLALEQSHCFGWDYQRYIPRKLGTGPDVRNP